MKYTQTGHSSVYTSCGIRLATELNDKDSSYVGKIVTVIGEFYHQKELKERLGQLLKHKAKRSRKNNK